MTLGPLFMGQPACLSLAISTPPGPPSTVRREATVGLQSIPTGCPSRRGVQRMVVKVRLGRLPPPGTWSSWTPGRIEPDLNQCVWGGGVGGDVERKLGSPPSEPLCVVLILTAGSRGAPLPGHTSQPLMVLLTPLHEWEN